MHLLVSKISLLTNLNAHSNVVNLQASQALFFTHSETSWLQATKHYAYTRHAWNQPSRSSYWPTLSLHQPWHPNGLTEQPISKDSKATYIRPTVYSSFSNLTYTVIARALGPN